MNPASKGASFCHFSITASSLSSHSLLGRRSSDPAARLTAVLRSDVRRGSPDPADRPTAGPQATRQRSGTGSPTVAEVGRVIRRLPEPASTGARFTLLDGRPVEVSRGFWNSSAIGTRKRVQPTAARLGIAVLFLSKRSPSLNLIERRCKLTRRIQRC